MEPSTVATNLHLLRNERNLSQERLAARAGLSRAAYGKIERGSSQPTVETLRRLAAALEVSLDELVRPVHELRSVRFRSRKRLRTRQRILVEIGRWLHDFVALESLLDDHPPRFSGHAPISRPTDREPPEDAAARVRASFGLGPSEAVRDICGLLEANGVKMRALPVASHNFFGLSVAKDDGGPAIVVNDWERIPVERWIFTVAHELGHLVLHLDEYDVAQQDEPAPQEAEANAFAAAFLMPEPVFWREWDDTYGLEFVQRVLKVKRMFHVSYRTVLYRLHQRGSVAGNVWARFQRDYQARYGRALLRSGEPEALARDAFRASFPESRSSAEPAHLSPSDFTEDRLSRLVRRAVEDDQISLARAGEILAYSLPEMRRLASSWVG